MPKALKAPVNDLPTEVGFKSLVPRGEFNDRLSDPDKRPQKNPVSTSQRLANQRAALLLDGSQATTGDWKPKESLSLLQICKESTVEK